MFDPNFDPLEILKETQDHLKQCSDLVFKLSKELKLQVTLNHKIIDQLNLHTDVINRQEETIIELHNRLRLIEVARQYENTNQNDKNPLDTDTNSG